MNSCKLGIGLIGLVLLLGATSPMAQDKPATAGAPESKPAKKDAKAKAAVKPVDINSAGKAELKKLPGIGDAEADKIIASRPFNSKADLVTRGIITEGAYAQIRRQIIALPKAPPATKPSAKKG